MADNANAKIANLTEKLAIGVITLILGLVQMQYQADRSEWKSEQKELNTKVLDLYRTSVTKTELKELEDRLTKNVDGIRSDIRGILGLYVEEGNRQRANK